MKLTLNKFRLLSNNQLKNLNSNQSCNLHRKKKWSSKIKSQASRNRANQCKFPKRPNFKNKNKENSKLNHNKMLFNRNKMLKEISHKNLSKQIRSKLMFNQRKLRCNKNLSLNKFKGRSKKSLKC